MFRIRSGVAMAVGLGLAALTALVPASSFADSPNYVALRNGTSADPQGPQNILDMRGANTNSGGQAICFLAEFINFGVLQDNQLWELRPTGEKSDGADFVSIINKNSQLALAVPAPVSHAGDFVFQEPLGITTREVPTSQNTKWLEFSPNGGNGIVFKNQFSGMVLDASGANTNTTCSGRPNPASDFTHVVQAPENDNPSQLWFFFP